MEKEIVYCRNCKNSTNHDVLYGKCYSCEEGFEDHCYYVLKCCGCSEVTFLHKTKYWDNSEPKMNIYPECKPDDHEKADLWEIPKKLEHLYTESIKSYNSECYVLCAVGLRSIIEGICKNKNVSGGNLYSQIESLASVGQVIAEEVDTLHFIRNMGNKSIHEIEIPKAATLKQVFRFIEMLFYRFYEKHV